MSKVFLVTGNKRVEKSAKLAEVVENCFAPASASASVSGVNRGKLSEYFAANIPALGKFDAIVLETEEEIITVKNEDLPQVLLDIRAANDIMAQAREAVRVYNVKYDSVRTSVEKNPTEKGKQGRKAQAIESRFAEAFN